MHSWRNVKQNFQENKIYMDNKSSLSTSVVDHMMENDFFSQWMGVEVLSVSEGYSKIRMTIRKEMVNGFGIVHGGIPGVEQPAGTG